MKNINLTIDKFFAFRRKARYAVRFLGGMGMVAVMIYGGIASMGWTFIFVFFGVLGLGELLVWLTRKT